MTVEVNKFGLPLFLCVCLSVQLCIGGFTSWLLQKGSIMKTCGKAIPWSDTPDFQNCSVQCLKENWCISILFNRNAILSERCKLISPESTGVINLDGMPGFEHFALSMKSCNNMGIGTPTGWRSGCPTVYISLDSQHTGSAVNNADFLSSGKLGQALNVPTISGSDGYYNLGNFPNLYFCFPDPSRCPDGVTFAFWMKLASFPATGNEGYLTTAYDGGPGFRVYSKTTGLYFLFRRYVGTKQTYVLIADASFQAEFGFATWAHYIITYRYNYS